MLEKIWKISYILLMNKLNVSTTLEISMAVSYRTKYTLTI